VNATWFAVRAGLTRGRIEFRQALTSAQDMYSMLFFSVVTLVVIIFMRGTTVPGTHFSLGAVTLPSALGMAVASMGVTITAQLLTIEREDGTLLRAKAIPNGMVGHLVGKIVLVTGMTVVGILVLLVPGLFLVQGVGGGVGSWLTLIGVVVLGLVATMPLGAIFGSLFANPRSGALLMLPFLGLTAISGIYYPITRFPAWLCDIAQVFPVYWLGLGMRSALLPADMAAAEIGGSWRSLATVGVLGGWAVLGLTIAPIVLRRMARRESGSSVAARRQRAMQRVG
jgi:ABC-2 type transport system permease protein